MSDKETSTTLKSDLDNGSSSTQDKDSSSNQSKLTRLPKARLYRTDTGWALQLALPNVKLTDIKVEEQAGKLTIQAESSHIQYLRSFILPNHSEFSEISATLNLGILTLKLTSAEPTLRKINIQSAS